MGDQKHNVLYGGQTSYRKTNQGPITAPA